MNSYINEKYWNEFYSKEKSFKNSNFSELVRELAIKYENTLVFDIGCGNGKDSIFF